MIYLNFANFSKFLYYLVSNNDNDTISYKFKVLERELVDIPPANCSILCWPYIGGGGGHLSKVKRAIL